MSDTIVMIYCPFPSIEAARGVATVLIGEKLVACCNITSGESLYHWEGKLESTGEYYLLAKTTADAAPLACTRIASLHPYDTPAILHFEAAANGPFATWVKAETGK